MTTSGAAEVHLTSDLGDAHTMGADKDGIVVMPSPPTRALAGVEDF